MIHPTLRDSRVQWGSSYIIKLSWITNENQLRNTVRWHVSLTDIPCLQEKQNGCNSTSAFTSNYCAYNGLRWLLFVQTLKIQTNLIPQTFVLRMMHYYDDACTLSSIKKRVGWGKDIHKNLNQDSTLRFIRFDQISQILICITWNGKYIT